MARQTKKEGDALSEMLDRYRISREASLELYDKAKEDILFVSVPGHQWDAKLKSRRADRPCYEFPKLQAHVRQVVNEMRQTRPMGKVRGMEESDTGLAEIMNGLSMNILDASNADLAHDIAFESAVKGGMGVWRITTDYADEDSFDQCIWIKPIRNFSAVTFDSASVEIDKRDSRFVFVEEFIPRSEFERQYPDADLHDFDGDSRAKDWLDADKVRICEYWYKKPVKRQLLALSNGETVWEDETDMDALQASGIQISNERTVASHKVCMRLTNGASWLTAEQEFPSKFIPIIPVWGEIESIDGEDHWMGLVRSSKDQQRLHNVHRTAIIEAVAKAPKAPFITKLSWIKGFESFWNKANAEDRPYLPIAEGADGTPARAQQAEVPTALIQLANMDNDDIKAATGIFNPSLGLQGNETSGAAIQQRKVQSQVSTFNYIDNLSRAIHFEYEILVDMIPRVYDTQRVIRVLGQDGGQKWVQLYQQVQDLQSGQTLTLNDISKGRYDVTITVGPAYATQRQEAVTAFAQLVGQVGSSFPPLGELLSYMVVKNLDLPGNEEVSEAVRRILVNQGLLQPQPGDQPPPQQQGPNPAQQAQMAKMQAETQLQQAKAQRESAEAQAVLPKAQAQIERDRAIAGHHQVDDALAVSDHAATQTLAHDARAAMYDASIAPPNWPMVRPTPVKPGAFNPSQ